MSSSILECPVCHMPLPVIMSVWCFSFATAQPCKFHLDEHDKCLIYESHPPEESVRIEHSGRRYLDHRFECLHCKATFDPRDQGWTVSQATPGSVIEIRHADRHMESLL